MNNFQTIIENYLIFCQSQKRLDQKTLKAYRIDLTQFSSTIKSDNISTITTEFLEDYISELHHQYKPKTVKRKIASIKALFHYMEYKEHIECNPFNKVHIKFREPSVLPKTIPLHIVESLLSVMYQQLELSKTIYQKRNTLRDIAVIELLFATGMRISELCSLQPTDVNLNNGIILIYGKGAKERKLQIGNQAVLSILKEYYYEFENEILYCNYFFANQQKRPLSDQAVRRMIRKYAALSGIHLHITPHMFRHTFATSLLDADVDIRYIQEMLGHSSITVTQIYTHVSLSKQLDILSTKHPRKDFRV